MQTNLRSFSSRCSITTDCWTSKSNQAYIGITCHYINEDFDLISNVLSLKHLTDNHTADYIHTNINCVLRDWDLENKVNTFNKNEKIQKKIKH